MVDVALYQPEIPPNTGNIARFCAATNTRLNILGQTGFRMDARTVRRAGLDYWPHVILQTHESYQAFREMCPDRRVICLTTKANRSYADWIYSENDTLLFGPETRGLPDWILEANAERCLTIPMANTNVRSLNLATSVSIVLFEALRQLGRLG